MGTNYKQQAKRLYGHSDYGPVLANDNFSVSATGSDISGHTVIDSWTLARDTQVHGATAYVKIDALTEGQIDWAVTHDGTVAVSGTMLPGARTDAIYLPKDRQNALVVDSGTLLEVVYAIPVATLTTHTIEVSVPVTYLGQE